MSSPRINPRVHTAPDETDCLVLLNEESGQWHALNPSGALCWQELARTGSIDAAVAAVASRYPGAAVDQVRADLAGLVGELLHRGLLTPAAVASPVAGKAMAITPRADLRASPADRIAALIALPIALAALRLGFDRGVRALTLVRRRLPARPASLPEAQAAVAAAALAAHWYPGRAACLERSLAAVLSAALRGRRIDWCLGAATDPRRFHAWAEAEGQPVTTPDDEPVEPAYRRVLTI